MLVRWLSVLLALVASCSDAPAASDTASGPASQIASVAWPTDPTGIQAAFDRLPNELGGLQRQEGSTLSTSYGEGEIRIWAEDMSAAECPGLAGVDLLRAALERNGAITTDEASSDPTPEGQPPYLIGHRPEGIQLAAWMAPGTTWVFVVEAGSVELRDAGVGALVDAARG